MILYFSATGNSKYCAERIAASTSDALVSLNECMKKGITEVDCSDAPQLGIVCPTYDFNMPWAVTDYLKSLTLKNLPLDCYLFGVFTCGKSCGFAEETLSAVISEKGLKLSAAYMIPMPDNYIPMFPLISKEEQNKMLSEAEPLLDGAISNIKSRNKATINSQKPPKPVAYLIRKVFIPKQQKARDNFWITDSCVGCGFCESICPKNIIHLENNRPAWEPSGCACCLGCMHRCPQQAIQYGKKRKAQADIFVDKCNSQ